MNDAQTKEVRFVRIKRVLTVREKLQMRYALAFVFGFLIGLIGYYVLRIPESAKLNSYISKYFNTTFDTNGSTASNCSAILGASFSDLKTLGLIFVSGFTMFSSIAIYWLLFSQALSLAMSSLYLTNVVSCGSVQAVGFLDLVLFLFLGASVSSVFIIFSSKTRIFNDQFRALGNRKRLIIRSKPLYVQFFTLLTLCGAIMLINCLRFLINLI